MTVKELFDKVYNKYHIDESLEVNITTEDEHHSNIAFFEITEAIDVLDVNGNPIHMDKITAPILTVYMTDDVITIIEDHCLNIITKGNVNVWKFLSDLIGTKITG